MNERMNKLANESVNYGGPSERNWVGLPRDISKQQHTSTLYMYM